MKKILMVSLLLIAAAGGSYAQTWSEWFRQNSTQKKYLLQQIAALKVYIDYGQKGYRIAKDGLNGIGNFAGSEFNLHSTFLNSRSTVNPKIKRYEKVGDIIAIQQSIAANIDHTLSDLSKTASALNPEFPYIKRVYNRVLQNCTSLLDELTAVTTDGQLKMTDDERIERIDQLYNAMQDNWDFCKTFSGQALKTALARKYEMNEIQTSNALQGGKTP